MDQYKELLLEWSFKQYRAKKNYDKLVKTISGGLCEKLDTRTKSDYGHRCKHWKAIPYKFNKKYKLELDNPKDYYLKS